METKTPIRLLRVKNLPNSNDHYTNPYKAKEVVEYRGEIEPKDDQPKSFTQQFIRIFRPRTKETMVESRRDFERIGNWEFDQQ